jgi:hypothetical protein
MTEARNWMVKSMALASALLLGACAGGDPSSPQETSVESSSNELARVCRSDAQCPVPRGPCRLCPDGKNASCPESVCQSGQCSIRWTPCPGLVQCGGFAGLPCPAGFECVDDPRDDCSPCRGGADCGGICVELSCTPKCDPSLICTQVLTCVGGQLYPTGCGPRNCDRPLGPCDVTTQAQ